MPNMYGAGMYRCKHHRFQACMMATFRRNPVSDCATVHQSLAAPASAKMASTPSLQVCATLETLGGPVFGQLFWASAFNLSYNNLHGQARPLHRQAGGCWPSVSSS